MSKKLFNIIIISSVLILLTITFVYSKYNNTYNRDVNTIKGNIFDAKNSTFKIDNEIITLKNGISNKSSSVVRYFGNDAVGDINGDGLDDIVFIITQDNGGSGIFYYAIVAINNINNYILTNPFFIGDRISPQSTEIHSDSKEIHVNFAKRNDGEAMTTQPSVGAVLLLKVTDNNVLQGLMK